MAEEKNNTGTPFSKVRKEKQTVTREVTFSHEVAA